MTNARALGTLALAAAITLGLCVCGPRPADGMEDRLTLAPPSEPGTPLVIDGTLLGPDGDPLPDTEVRVYQTDAEGYYARGEDGKDLGWRHARLDGTLRTDDRGRFRVRTIRPAGYPDRPTPQHVHFRLTTPEGSEKELTLFFEDDPRLTPGLRQELERWDVTFFRPVETGDDGSQRCTVELRLP